MFQKLRILKCIEIDTFKMTKSEYIKNEIHTLQAQKSCETWSFPDIVYY